MTEVTRSSLATGDAAAARVSAARRSLPNGWWGMLLLICVEATLFGTLVASYVYLRLQTPTWPPAGIDPPSVAAPLALTAVLVATTVPMVLASRAAQAGRRSSASRLIVAATLVQAAYLAVQIVLFLDDLSSFDPRETSYGSVYFTLLGAHHAHVVVGVLLNVGIVIRLLGGLTNYRLIGVRALALYWYFVNAMAIVVVLTQLSPALL
jgi:heme/copper-type cytochrome/quinol oxidase subunit 3